jgi:hypothetical protein
VVLTYCTVTRLAGQCGAGALAQALMLQPAQAGAQQPARRGRGKRKTNRREFRREERWMVDWWCPCSISFLTVVAQQDRGVLGGSARLARAEGGSSLASSLARQVRDDAEPWVDRRTGARSKESGPRHRCDRCRAAVVLPRHGKWHVKLLTPQGRLLAAPTAHEMGRP